MKKLLSLLVYSLLTVTAHGQFLSQSAEGKSSMIIPLNGSVVGFDIGKTEIAVGANNFAKVLDGTDTTFFRHVFIGGNLSVKNSSGIGNLFQTGDIVPAGNFLGFLGLNFNNNRSILDKWKISEVATLRSIEQEKRVALVDNYRRDIAKYIEIAGELIEDMELKKKTVDADKKRVTDSKDGFALSRSIIAITTKEDEKLKEYVSTLKEILVPRQKLYIDSLGKVDVAKALDTAFNRFAKANPVIRFSPFIFGGIDARNFAWYQGLNKTTLSKSFIDTLYRGGLFGVGVNAQVGSYWLGATYAYIDGDNFSNLSSKEYVLRTTDTAGNQTLQSEKKITGYSGKYSKVQSNQLNIDLAKEFHFNDTSRMIINLYYRGTLVSRDTAYLKNISNIGLGLYFLGKKSKFMGGLYVELPDINNSVERSKPEADQHIRPPYKKLTFGVVTRFSLSSVFGFTDRARKPD